MLRTLLKSLLQVARRQLRACTAVLGTRRSLPVRHFFSPVHGAFHTHTSTNAELWSGVVRQICTHGAFGTFGGGKSTMRFPGPSTDYPWEPWVELLEAAKIRYWLRGVRYQKKLPTAGSSATGRWQHSVEGLGDALSIAEQFSTPAPALSTAPAWTGGGGVV
jgi:hypothetical protein